MSKYEFQLSLNEHSVRFIFTEILSSFYKVGFLYLEFVFPSLNDKFNPNVNCPQNYTTRAIQESTLLDPVTLPES